MSSFSCVHVSAPATVANVGPGFDVFGFAVDEPNDTIIAMKTTQHPGEVLLKSKDALVPAVASKNTAGIAAQYVLTACGVLDFGIEMELIKGMGVGTGLGSSASSAAAAAKAVQALLQSDRYEVPEHLLVSACIAAEEAIDGAIHGDNAIPSLLGGFIVVPSSRDPLLYSRLDLPSNLRVVLVTPPISVLTADARRVVPQTISLSHAVHNMGHAALIVAGVAKGDPVLMGRGVSDVIIEPARASLIPNFLQVKEAALAAGAYGCSISGSGPTVFALASNDTDLEAIGSAMSKAFQSSEPPVVRYAKPNNEGARVVHYE